jgi:hypothetical protein
VITWAGDPDKPVEKTGAGERISPPRSFAKWQQTFHDVSEPWTAIDRTFAAALRPVITETLFLCMNAEVLRLNLELARSNAELASFAYSASHELQVGEGTGASFFNAYGGSTGARWMEFKGFVSASVKADHAEDVVEAARETFICFYDWLGTASRQS